MILCTDHVTVFQVEVRTSSDIQGSLRTCTEYARVRNGYILVVSLGMWGCECAASFKSVRASPTRIACEQW